MAMGYGERLIQQGFQEGVRQGAAGSVVKLLRQRFGELPDEVVARVEGASLAEIERWAERILTAETLEALLW